MSEKIKIMVIRESVRESWLIDGGTFLMCLAVMVISRFMESPAMGWFGGILLFLGIFVRFSSKQKKFFTISEARVELDRIEKSL